jgi:outer membrane protein assembly factor BamA
MKLRLINTILIFLLNILNPVVINSQKETLKNEKNEWEAFPILNYDTDVGFGYGAKGFFYNFMNHGESFDLTIFNSTKGERWYQLIYSAPDKQRRQGKKYDFAFDLMIDYDKWINYSFYNYEEFEPYYPMEISSKKIENYVREPIEISALFSRAFTRDFIADLGIRYRSISCYDFDPDGQLKFYEPAVVMHFSVLFNFGLDTRINFINPAEGIVLKINNELSRDISGSHESYFRIGLLFQSYCEIIKPGVVWASRIILDKQTETSFQNLLSLGGNKSIRGLPQDRYLSSSSILLNEELRILIWWRFGAVAGLDVGNSPSTPEWIVNTILGLRFNMDNFIVRADFGIGKSSTGFYFNFGHLF